LTARLLDDHTRVYDGLDRGEVVEVWEVALAANGAYKEATMDADLPVKGESKNFGSFSLPCKSKQLISIIDTTRVFVRAFYSNGGRWGGVTRKLTRVSSSAGARVGVITFVQSPSGVWNKLGGTEEKKDGEEGLPYSYFVYRPVITREETRIVSGIDEAFFHQVLSLTIGNYIVLDGVVYTFFGGSLDKADNGKIAVKYTFTHRAGFKGVTQEEIDLGGWPSVGWPIPDVPPEYELMGEIVGGLPRYSLLGPDKTRRLINPEFLPGLDL